MACPGRQQMQPMFERNQQTGACQDAAHTFPVVASRRGVKKGGSVSVAPAACHYVTSVVVLCHIHHTHTLNSCVGPGPFVPRGASSSRDRVPVQPRSWDCSLSPAVWVGGFITVGLPTKHPVNLSPPGRLLAHPLAPASPLSDSGLWWAHQASTLGVRAGGSGLTSSPQGHDMRTKSRLYGYLDIFFSALGNNDSWGVGVYLEGGGGLAQRNGRREGRKKWEGTAGYSS
jgi:hypothetical protein